MMTEIDLRPPFDRLWKGEDPFEKVFALGGEEFRSVKNRRTFRIEIGGEGFFVKIHRGAGWAEIFKNLVQFKMPVTGAGNEYRALKKLREAGIPTMEIAAFGERGVNPANRESFLITRELTGTRSLEDVALGGAVPVPLKHRIIRALGASCGAMHRAGVNHRDCYLCHYLLRVDPADAPDVKLSVIDLHRAQIRRTVPFRYRVKDVAGLLFSSFDVPLCRADVWRFLHAYWGKKGSIRGELAENRRFYEAVHRSARKLYFKEFAKHPEQDPFAREKGMDK